MNEDILRGKWAQLRGELRSRWGALTDSDLERVDGQRERLSGLLQEKYGYAKERADQEIDSFLTESDLKHGRN